MIYDFIIYFIICCKPECFSYNALENKKAHLSMSFSSEKQDRTADLRVMNPAL